MAHRPLTRAFVLKRFRALGVPITREELHGLSRSRFRANVVATLQKQAPASEARQELQQVMAAFRAEPAQAEVSCASSAQSAAVATRVPFDYDALLRQRGALPSHVGRTGLNLGGARLAAIPGKGNANRKS